MSRVVATAAGGVWAAVSAADVAVVALPSGPDTTFIVLPLTAGT
jgi:hypothetical protein